MTVYDFTAKDNRGQEVSLEAYRGQVLLIVNTATKCGLTPQYEALEATYQTYRGRGFAILDFPCNQFMRQAPGTDEDIQTFCTLRYNTTFPRFAKVNVNGKEAHPLFVWLREQAAEDEGDEKAKSFEKKVKLMKPLGKAGDIKWNFGKFLIGRDGQVAGRYSPAFTPDKLAAAIEAALV
ncbi:MAG: glutathione peroxidase [Oscillospiraceae bacterium]|jgi:glutathione peroxidase|nr:glutathione peroxidase [Oscillospiraceae bacterium]